jgi:hypothetical protein
MSTVARQVEQPAIEPTMADDKNEPMLRDLLIKYQRALDLVGKLAIALLDSVQPDAEPMSPEEARERRHTVAEAMTMVASETPHGEQLWRELAVDRRLAHPDAPLPAAVRVDRRRKVPRRAAASIPKQ